MTLRLFRIPAAFVLFTALLASSTLAQVHPAAPESPYGGNTVEEIVARVNDQVITRSDYDRAMKELDDEARQKGATLQEISEGHKDLLRNLIDQQLWLAKGKELDVTGETELIKQLDEIRKKYNLETIEDLEKAAKEQGVSFEDFKANIRNSIITQQVMRDEVGRRIQITPGEVERYYEAHKQEYAQQENVHLAEILISTGTPAPSDSGTPADDPQKLAAAKSKADDIEAKLHAGGDFSQLAHTFSDGSTASEGGDLGQYKRGSLAKVLEDQTFALKTGQFTEPIRTRQGYVILKVIQHTPGGVPPFKDVQDQVEQAYYFSKMEPAVREYLSKMREDDYIDIKPGYTDTGANPKSTKPVYSAYTPPTAKKKKKVVRTRFRETTRTFRQKSPQTAAAATPAAAPPAEPGGPAEAAPAARPKTASAPAPASMKPGKKEKIRFGQAPSKTLPTAPSTTTEDAGATTHVAANTAAEPANPLEAPAAPEKKTRFAARAKLPKQPKPKGPQPDAQAPAAADAAEVADRQTQAGPLGLAGDTATKKKKKATTTADKTRLADKNKKPAEPAPDSTATPSAPAPQSPAPAPAPQPAPPQQPQP
jgi:peptidyl-prolyl cis-trans isomerase SurA